ncbi:MAG: S-layer homology domain-containing protein [Thermoanaerobaculaceae bacterium]|nr:S-layer homology domain-containing protein [Thermoanaerobaculaceae bacterium]
MALCLALAAPATLLAQGFVEMELPDGQLHQVPVGGPAATPDRANAPEEFGTSGIFAWQGAAAFRPDDSTTVYDTGSTGTYFYLYKTAGSGWFVAPFEVPSGAYVTHVRLYLNDTDASNGLTLSLCRNWVNDSTGVSPGADCPWSVTTTGTPGYSSIALTPSTNLLHWFDVDSDGTDEDVNYSLWVLVGGTTTATSFMGVRTLWNRQVSAAPASAHFTDVPTSYWGFQYVEALRSAGITSGCNPPTNNQYCPESYVKRSEMAKFLAVSLGLHWPY